MRAALFTMSLAFLSACAASTDGGATAEQADHLAESGYPTICDGHRPWALNIALTGLGAHEGERVWAIGIAPEDLTTADPWPGDYQVAALLTARAHDGTATLNCAGALDENTSYPSLAVVLDADNDGQMFRF